MAIRIVKLGSPRAKDEGLRIGTVRRPPRGVPKDRFASDDWYDVWLPNLAPTAELMTAGRTSTTAKEWDAFVRKFRTQMNEPDAGHLLDTLAALSHQTNFAVGCYCEEESHCHRSVLRELFEKRGATVV